MKKKVIILVAVLILVFVGGVMATKIIQKNKINALGIVVYDPKANSVIQSPLLIEGKAKGNWFFEGSFSVELTDESRKHFATGIVQTRDDWMTEDFVSFDAKLEFISNTEIKGLLIFRNANPSGLPENSQEFIVPVIIPKSETSTIKVYFNNNQMDPEISCNKVFPVERTIKKTEAVGRAAIEELLKGPTEQERKQGFFTSINSGVKIQQLTIENGIAKIDFNETLQAQVGGSCMVSAIRAEIIETLKQFSTVQNVIISIDGKTEDILQP